MWEVVIYEVSSQSFLISSTSSKSLGEFGESVLDEYSIKKMCFSKIYLFVYTAEWV